MIFVPLDQKACSWIIPIVYPLMMTRLMIGMIVVSITRKFIAKLIQICSNVGTIKCLLVCVNIEKDIFEIEIRRKGEEDLP